MTDIEYTVYDEEIEFWPVTERGHRFVRDQLVLYSQRGCYIVQDCGVLDRARTVGLVVEERQI